MAEANDKAQANDKDSLLNQSQASTNLDDIDEDEYCRCCCCLCACSKKETEDLSCFGCIPVKCGIYCIALFGLFLTLFIFAETFTHFISEYIAWWYVLICILLQIPLIIGTIFFLNWIGEDSYSTRGKLRSACILTIVSYSLQSIWSIIYFLAIFKRDSIVIAPETKFAFTCNKKIYLFWVCFFTVWVNFSFGYFICVTGRYTHRLRERDEKKAEEPVAAEAPAEESASPAPAAAAAAAPAEEPAAAEEPPAEEPAAAEGDDAAPKEE